VARRLPSSCYFQRKCCGKCSDPFEQQDHLKSEHRTYSNPRPTFRCLSRPDETLSSSPCRPSYCSRLLLLLLSLLHLLPGQLWQSPTTARCHSPIPSAVPDDTVSVILQPRHSKYCTASLFVYLIPRVPPPSSAPSRFTLSICWIHIPFPFTLSSSLVHPVGRLLFYLVPSEVYPSCLVLSFTSTTPTLPALPRYSTPTPP
jgi:hypothetical protein